MSRSFSPERTFHCSNDCKQSGCPGHTMKIEYSHTSDTVSVIVDGRIHSTFDQTEWIVMINLDKDYRDAY